MTIKLLTLIQFSLRCVVFGDYTKRILENREEVILKQLGGLEIQRLAKIR